MPGYESEIQSRLDPRTKLLMVVTITTVVVGGSGAGWMGAAKPLIASIPFILYLLDRKYKPAAFYAAAYSIALFGEYFVVQRTFGVLNFILVAAFMILTRFMPGFAMAGYLMTTTTVSAFMAAMERMHMPQCITVPLAVTFRFFPTIGEEYGAIRQAMAVRGVRFGGGKPSKMIEYRLIPLMVSCMNITDELSAAALTRGLGSAKHRTNICKIGFHALDRAAISFCALSWAALLFDWIVR